MSRCFPPCLIMFYIHISQFHHAMVEISGIIFWFKGAICSSNSTLVFGGIY